jgi:hypothetical protein
MALLTALLNGAAKPRCDDTERHTSNSVIRQIVSDATKRTA